MNVEAQVCLASWRPIGSSWSIGLIAAGLNPKQISVYIGHSDIRTTYNRYGHLMPGGEAEAAEKLDAFLGAGTAAGASS